MKHFLSMLTVFFMLAFFFYGCGNKNSPPEESITPEPPVTASPSLTFTPTPLPTATLSPTPTPEPTPTPYNGPVNPLTGTPVDKEISMIRPFAVMLNNIREAQPQHGQSQADIIYEVLAEGGITRMLAVYADISQAGTIGSIRSARTYYIDLAQGHDAIYVHAGGSPQAYSNLSSRDIDNIDFCYGYDDMCYRDRSRIEAGYAYEHTLFTSGELLSQVYETNIRTEHDEAWRYHMNFSDDGTPPGGKSAQHISAVFSDYKSSVFDYDNDTGLYMVSQYDGPYTDGNSQQQVAVTNVIIINTSVSMISGDNMGRIDVDLIGSGSAAFACGGRYIDITWTKDSFTSQLVYTDTDGNEIALGRGKTYICILPLSKSPVIE
ncbi:MAG: DUF3048 domain-containing protein [Clostridiales bacterium]|nr:DUF3048 domain-containing protein [Clostridiales bacterium]